MKTTRILITSPSLNASDNVSGISSLVSDIIKYSSCRIDHFILGSKDCEKKNIRWLLNQLQILRNFASQSSKDSFDILHLNTGLEKFSILRDSIIAFIAKKLYKKQVLLHLHGGFYMFNKTKGLTSFCLKNLLKNADAVIVLSEEEKVNIQVKYNISRCNVLPNAIDYSFTDKKARVLNEALKVIFLGRINESKGLETIVSGFRQLNGSLKHLEFDVYGSGPALKKWNTELQEIKGLSYQYKGVAAGAAKWQALQEADVFVLPSIHSEGMPIAILEAMAAGCAVITTDDGSIKSVVKNSYNGILIPKHSPKRFAETLKEIIDGQIDIKELGRNAQSFAQSNLSFSTYIQKLDGIYHKLMIG